MIAVKEDTYNHIIRECFATDAELLATFHIEAPADVDTCTNRTIEDLKKAPNFTFYSLKEGNEIVGFFGVSYVEEIYYLNGFFLKAKYRHMKKEFLDEIKKKTSNTFYTGIHVRNKRAEKFLLKHGVIEQQDDTYKLFKMEPCL